MPDLYFGLTQGKWQEAVKEMRKILIARAKRNATIYYSELTEKLLPIANIEPHSYAMANMLGEISVDEHNSGKPLLSAEKNFMLYSLFLHLFYARIEGSVWFLRFLSITKLKKPATETLL